MKTQSGGLGRFQGLETMASIKCALNTAAKEPIRLASPLSKAIIAHLNGIQISAWLGGLALLDGLPSLYKQALNMERIRLLQRRTYLPSTALDYIWNSDKKRVNIKRFLNFFFSLNPRSNDQTFHRTFTEHPCSVKYWIARPPCSVTQHYVQRCWVEFAGDEKQANCSPNISIVFKCSVTNAGSFDRLIQHCPKGACAVVWILQPKFGLLLIFVKNVM